MPTLARRQDSQHIVRHLYQDSATWQISPDGVSYLRRRRIEQDGRFTTEQFMHLWMNGSVYTGDRPDPVPGPLCVGDRDVPQDLRDAIHKFHSTVKNGQLAAAWRFVSTMSVPESLMHKDMLDAIDAQQFEMFEKKITDANRSRLHSWRLLDVRTVVSSVEDIATVEINGGLEHGTTAPISVELNETWVPTPLGWRVKWDGFPGLK